jgi:ribulose-bisphosphate carboxylase large chain
MIARAGGLDQGNIGLNLADARQRGLESNILFLAGSAINSIKNEQGNSDAAVGAEAMLQAIELHYSGKLDGVPAKGVYLRIGSLSQIWQIRFASGSTAPALRK